MSKHSLIIPLLFCFLYKSLSSNKNSSEILCNEDILSRYIGQRTFKSENKKPIMASYEIRNICPTMEITCCSHTELFEMTKTLSLKIEKANALIVLFDKFIQRLSFLRSGDIEILYKTSLNNPCSTFSKKEFQGSLEYIKKFKTDIVENFRRLINVDVQYNRGFVCGLCNPKSTGTFDQDVDGSYWVNVNVNSCLKYIPIVADFLPNVIYSFHKIEVLIKTIGCEVGLPFSLDLSINHNSQKLIFEEEMRKCDNAVYIMQSSKCMEFCNLGILNNFWGSFVVDVIQVANMILNNWEESQNVSHFEEGIEHINFEYDELKFQYFIDPIKSVVGMNLEDYPIKIVNENGWDLFNNQIIILSNVFRFSFKIIFAIGLLIMIKF